MRTFLKTAPFLLLVAFLSSPATAQNWNCDDPQVQQEMNYCAEQEWKEADRRLNAEYRKARAAMQNLDDVMPEGQKGAAVALRDAQRAWITFRDKACEAEGWLFRGGTMEPLIYWTCMSSLTEQRTKSLEVLSEMN